MHARVCVYIYMYIELVSKQDGLKKFVKYFSEAIAYNYRCHIFEAKIKLQSHYQKMTLILECGVTANRL